jgi:hypothetical protein
VPVTRLTKIQVFTTPQASRLGAFCFQNQRQLERNSRSQIWVMLALIVAGKKRPEIPIMVVVSSIAAAMGEAPEMPAILAQLTAPWREFESSIRMPAKISAGEAITHELINIAHTRQSAQFSLGKANLIHYRDLASRPGKIIFHIQDWVRILFQTSLHVVRMVRTIKYADEPLEANIRMAVALRIRFRFPGEGGRG